MKSKKTIIALAIISALLLLTACGTQTDTDTDTGVQTDGMQKEDNGSQVKLNITADSETETEDSEDIEENVTSYNRSLSGDLSCKDACQANCNADADTACKMAEDYGACVQRCGDNIRDAGCKGACASGIPEECRIIFINECVDDCSKRCEQ